MLKIYPFNLCCIIFLNNIYSQLDNIIRRMNYDIKYLKELKDQTQYNSAILIVDRVIQKKRIHYLRCIVSDNYFQKEYSKC